MAYDGALLISVLFLATALLMPFTGGAIATGNQLFRIYLLIWSYLYFCWPWVKGGQTLGMRAWRIRVSHVDGGRLGWEHATLRFFLAIISWLLAGTGYLWSLFDEQKRTLHDRLSRTRLDIMTLVKDRDQPPGSRLGAQGMQDVDQQ